MYEHGNTLCNFITSTPSTSEDAAGWRVHTDFRRNSAASERVRLHRAGNLRVGKQHRGLVKLGHYMWGFQKKKKNSVPKCNK